MIWIELGPTQTHSAECWATHLWQHDISDCTSVKPFCPLGRKLTDVGPASEETLRRSPCSSPSPPLYKQHKLLHNWAQNQSDSRRCTVGALPLNTIWTEQTSAAKGHIIERMRDERRLWSLTLRWGLQMSYSFDSLLEIWRWLFRYQIYAQDTACGWKTVLKMGYWLLQCKCSDRGFFFFLWKH